MSNNSIENIKCPNCNKESEFVVWSSVNTDVNPELKDKVKDKSLFDFECPYCKEKAMISYDVLYHDMKEKQMIYYVTDEQSFNKAINMFNYEERNDTTSKVLEKYQKRVVVNQHQLAEKIIIKEQGLDDRLVEIIKLIFYMQLIEEKQDAEVDAIYYYYDSEKDANLIQFVFEGRVIASASFDENMYNDVKKEYGSKLVDFDKDVVINFDWVMNCFEGE